MWNLFRKAVVFAVASLVVEPLTASGQDRQGAVLAPSTPVRRELSNRESHSYQITLDSGRYLRVLVDQAGINLVVTVYGPTGAKLTESICREDGPKPVSLITDASGAYSLVVRSSDEEAVTGSYELKVEEVRDAASQDRTRIVAERSFDEAEQVRANGKADSDRQAIRKYQEALTQSLAAGDKQSEMRALIAIGETYHSLGEPKNALEYHSRALSLSRQMKDVRSEGEALNGLGVVYLRLGENQKALEYCTSALNLSREIRNRRGEARALNNLGEVHYAFGNRPKALEYYEQALPLWRDLAGRRGQAQTFFYLGSIHSDLSETEKARDAYKQALSLWRAVNDRRGQVLTLTAMGHLYSRLGEKQEALDLYDQARQLVQEISDPLLEAGILNGMAYVYEELGENDTSLEYYNRALRIYRDTSYKRNEAASLMAIGAVRRQKGEHQQALTYFHQALSVVQALNDKPLESYLLNNIAAVYDSLGDSNKALGYYEQALPLYRALGDQRGAAYALNGIGNIYDKWSRKEKALDYQNEALALNRASGDRFGEVSTLFNISRIERDLRRLTEARAHVEDATAKIERLRADVASHELRASFLATVRQNYELYIDLLMQQQKQQPSDALVAAALHISERARARSMIEMLTEARADIRRGVDGALLERERALRQLLGGKEELYGRLLAGKHTEEQATAAAKEIQSITTDYQRVQGQIRLTSPRYAALTQPQPLSVREIQRQVLDADTLLLEYALGDERSYVWAVTPDSLASFELPKRADVEAAARRVYELLASASETIKGETDRQREARLARAEACYPKAAAELSKMVLAPVASQLGTKRLLIVADGFLQYISFGALPAPAPGMPAAVAGKTTPGGERAKDDPQPLIADHEIISLPSASALAALRREIDGRKPAPRAVAVLADPVFDPEDSRVRYPTMHPSGRTSARLLSRDFERAIKETHVPRDGMAIARLPFSRREAQAIKAAAPPGEAMEAVDFEASRARAMSAELSQYRIIHFATHGLLNSEHPELSGIVLSLVDRQGQPQNGFLRVREVYNLNLPAELVVLSACQTALGKEVKGEGLVGLARGFMYAGAARVMASLWKVDDAATAELMRRFYGKMLGRGLRPAAALREAQVEMSKQRQWQAPYYWAGFVLQGEWR